MLSLLHAAVRSNQYLLRRRKHSSSSIDNGFGKVRRRCPPFPLTVDSGYESDISVAAAICGVAEAMCGPWLSNGAGKQNAGGATQPEAAREKLPESHGTEESHLPAAGRGARRVSGKLFKLKLHF